MDLDTFEADVKHAYCTLRDIAMAHCDALPPEFIAALSSEDYSAVDWVHPIAVPFAIIASHADWEVVYQRPVPGSSETIGELCGRLRQEGMERLDLTSDELEALRNEVLYGGKRYSDYRADLKDFTEHYAKTHNYQGLRHLLGVYMQFGRTEEAKRCLADLASLAAVEPDAPIDYAIFGALYYRRAGIEEADIEGVRQVLVSFGENEEANRLLGQYNHVTYMFEWAELIEGFFNALEDSHVDASEGVNSMERVVARVMRARRNAVVGFDPEFVNALPSDDLDLMKKHDEILLELVGLRPELAHSPFFRGTKALLWYRRLNLAYPGKLDDLLSDGIPAGAFKHPSNMTREEVAERLIQEFPEREGEIRDDLFPDEEDE